MNIPIRLTRIYHGMKTRCYNQKEPSYKNYGGRGIIVCEEWKNNSKTFYTWALENGYNDNLTIDRIDNDGPYAPWNCRWASNRDQARNTRRSIIVSINNEKISLPEAVEKYAKYTNITPKIVDGRLRNGWSIEKALNTGFIFNKYLYNGEYLTLKQLVDKYSKVSYMTAKRRLLKGWDIEKTLFTPPQTKKD